VPIPVVKVKRLVKQVNGVVVLLRHLPVKCVMRVMTTVMARLMKVVLASSVKDVPVERIQVSVPEVPNSVFVQTVNHVACAVFGKHNVVVLLHQRLKHVMEKTTIVMDLSMRP